MPLKTTKPQLVVLFGIVCGLAACSSLEDVPTVQPIPHTAAGAAQAADEAFLLFNRTIGDFMLAAGVFTDELTITNNADAQTLDKRQLDDENTDDSLGAYANLQNTRIAADVAARSLAALAPTAPSDVQGRMYAVEGYTELMLADLFCSGIPLSTLNLSNAQVVYGVGLPRDSVYQHAAAHFDSALTLAAGNDSLATLARVGKGRALLALGQFAAAAQAVSGVADDAHYKTAVGFAVENPGNATSAQFTVFSVDRVADHEGQVGLDYLSSHDPRTLSIKGTGADAPYTPNKYALIDSLVHTSSYTSYTRFMLADGVEARLIQAEAALHANDPATWLQILNHLRATAPVLAPVSTNFDPTITLSPLTDPGTSAARVDLMFAERAKWLYLTGHRQGDLRRLIRQYGRTQNQVYPTGTYAGGGTYGTSVNVPVPASEQTNPKFHGCLDRQP